MIAAYSNVNTKPVKREKTSLVFKMEVLDGAEL
jgi:hypothetical protein